MKQFYRCLTLLTALVLLVLLVPAASAAGTWSIEAFDPQTESVTIVAGDRCNLAVAMYSADHQLLWTDLQPVAGAPEQQTLPLDLPKEQPDNCTFNVFLLDPETNAPLCPSAAQGNGEGDNYAVTELTVDGDQILANVSADSACSVLVEVLTEDLSQVLHSGTAEIETAVQLQDVAVDGFGSLPEFYALRGVLVDSEGTALCSPYVTIRYTEAYQTFENTTPADFPDNLALDFGSNGFGVLVDDAVAVPGTAIALDEARSAFTFTAAELPQVGDVLLLTEESGVQSPLKVGTVTDNGDGTVTVTMDENAGVSDLYRMLKLDASLDLGQAIEGSGAVLLQEDKPQVDENLDLLKISQAFEAGPMKVDLSGTVRAVVKATYAPEVLGETYHEFETYVQTDIEATMTVSGDFKKSEMTDAFGNPKFPDFVIYKGPVAIVGCGLVAVNLEVTAPWDVGIEGGGKITATMSTKSGTKTNSLGGPQKIKSSEASGAVELYGKAEAKIGLDVAMKLFVIGDIFEGAVNCDAGIGVSLTPVLSVNDGTTGVKTHGCRLCLDGELYTYYGAHANVKMNLLGGSSFTLAAVDLLAGKHSLGQIYCSVINDADSLFHGKLHFDWGECPNYKYRVVTSTIDIEGQTVSGIPVTIERVDGANGPSPFTYYLYDGDYTASAKFEGGTFTESFTVKRDAVNVVIKEEKTTITGTVIDGVTGEPLGGAEVVVRWSDGRTDSTKTESDGSYSMVVIPGEQASVTASAAEHRSQTKDVDVKPGETHRVDLELMPGCRVTVTVVDQENKPSSGVTITGTKLESDPITNSEGIAYFELGAGRYTFIASNKNGSAYKTMDVMQDTELTLTLQSDFFEWSFDEPTGKLTLWGLGSMPGFGGSVPWKDHNEQIRTIEIIGLRTVTAYTFSELPALTEVQLPETMVTIGKNAFYKCAKLKKINFPDGMTTIYDGAFHGCTGLGPIVIPDSMTLIDLYAFCDCTSMTSVKLGSSVVTIGSSAFQNSGLTSLVIPESVKTVHRYAFSGCEQLRSVTVEGNEAGTVLDEYAFNACKALGTATLKDGVTKIGKNAFFNCEALSSVQFPETLLTIGDGAFHNCTALGPVTIPDSVTLIDLYAFCECTSMTSVKLGSSVATIGSSAFQNSGLTSLVIPESVKTVHRYAFSGCEQLRSVTVEGNEAGTVLDEYAFNACKALGTATLKDGVTKIGKNAFFNCEALSRVQFPDTLLSIGDGAFHNCTSLGSVTISDSVTLIDLYAFCECTSMTSVKLGSSVATIGSSAFQNSGLTSVVIPESVKTVHRYAFSGCEQLRSVTVEGNEAGTVLDEYAFNTCKTLRTVTLGDGVTKIGKNAFYNCEALSSVQFPNTLLSIGDGAFHNCTSLGSVTIPDSVSKIDIYAFCNCTSLSSVTIGAGVTSIGNSAFYNCKALGSVTYGGSSWGSIKIGHSNEPLTKAYQGS